MSHEDTERQRNRDTEKQSFREKEDTHETQEFPPLAARVSALPEAVQLSLQDGWKADCLFTFARAVKAFEITADRRLKPDELQNAFALWWSTATPLLPAGADFDEYRFTFEEAYEKARSPLGANQREEAIRRADTPPLPPQADRYSGSAIKRLVAVCYHLQVLSCGDPFFLSARDATRIAGKKLPRGGLAMLDGLVRDGVLILVEKGMPGGWRASRYRFNAPEFQRTDAAHSGEATPAGSSTETAGPERAKVLPAAPSSTVHADAKRVRPKPPLTHFQLVEKKKALEELTEAIERVDRENWTKEQRNEFSQSRKKLKAVTLQLANFGD